MKQVKTFVLLAAFLLISRTQRAQGIGGWFDQHSTRLKYYAQQIAALQVLLGEMKQGTLVSGTGLAAISASKQDEFALHQDYYASLGEINPAVRDMPEVAELGKLEAMMVQRFSDALTRYRNDGILGASWLNQLSAVYNGVLQECAADLATLNGVVNAGFWQMTDDQRLACIGRLDLRMKQRYAFVLRVTDETDLLEGQEAAGAAETRMVLGLYGGP